MKKIFKLLAVFVFIALLVTSPKSSHAYTFAQPMGIVSSGMVSSGEDFKGNVSGNYGALTVEAVRKYQAKHGLKADGSVGPKTLAVLNGGQVLGVNTGTDCKTAIVSTYAKYGDKGVDVVTIQTQLDCFGFTDGPNDGIYGKETMASIAAFQKSRGISGDGSVADINTLTALNITIVAKTATTGMISLVKDLVSDNGGPFNVGSWILTATHSSGTPVISGPSHTVGQTWAMVVPAGTYTLSETGPTGFLVTYRCIDSASGSTQVNNGNQLTVTSGAVIECRFTNDDIGPSLTLNKVVVGGSNPESAWTIRAVKISTTAYTLSGSGASGASDVVSDPVMMQAGTYTLSETGPTTGYTASPWSCTNGVTVNSSNQITLGLAQTTTCTITNTYVQQPPRATITLKKTIRGGGPANNQSFFTPSISGVSGVTWSTAMTVNPGTYTISETTQPDYAQGQWTGAGCSNSATPGTGSVTISAGQDIVCEITNTYVPPRASISLAKVTQNSYNILDGQTIYDHTYFQPWIGSTRAVWGINYVDPGTYTVSETWTIPNFVADPNGWQWDCAQNGTITIAPGENKVCTITNSQYGTLSLWKYVQGGGRAPADFPVSIDGRPAQWGRQIVSPGAHTVSEVTLPGYVGGGWELDCTVDGRVTVNPLENKTCTITNTFVQPQQATLTLIKTIDGGGPATHADFTPKIDGSSVGVSWGTPKVVTPGTHLVSESWTIPNYIKGRWGGDCANINPGTGAGVVNLAPGEHKTCTITNTYVPPPVCVVTDSSFTITPATLAWTSGNPRKLNYKVTWALPSNCGRAIIESQIGSATRNHYTTTLRSGSRNFSLTYTDQANTDFSLDVTLATYDRLSKKIISKTKTIPVNLNVSDLGSQASIASDGVQCNFDQFGATSSFTTSVSPSVSLSWFIPQPPSHLAYLPCDVYIEAWTKNPFNINSGAHPTITQIINPATGTNKFSTIGTITLTPTQSTTYYMYAKKKTFFGPHPYSNTVSVKTLDIERR
jgi:peptidoglycan hydrolase-like protein with peptidoglycan-binding domain